MTDLSNYRDGEWFLTREQRSTIAEIVQRWQRTGTSLEPCDRPSAEAAVAAAYTAAGLTPPSLVLWMESPFGGALAARAVRGRIGAQRLAALVAGRPAGALGGLVDRTLQCIAGQLPPGWADPDAPVDPWADRAAVRSQVSDAFYGTTPQREVLWNPIGRALESALVTAFDSRMQYEIYDDVDVVLPAADYWKSLQARLGGLQEAAFLGPVWQLSERLRQQLAAPAPGGVADLKEHDVMGVSPEPADVVFWREFGGYLDPRETAHIIAAFECAVRTVPLPGSPQLDALLAAIGRVGRWWPMRDAVVLTDRPRRREGRTELYLDGYRT